MLKKGRPKTSPAIKTFAEHNKVFARLFQKAAPSRARSSCRAPQSAKAPIGVFFLIAFSFAPVYAKEKAGEASNFLLCSLKKLRLYTVGANIVRPPKIMKILFS